MNQTTYPKRLIEVDLPIKEISKHARKEKSIRHGHISTLHIWWARRPLAACRAVICAALWPDPGQEDCPPKFREDASTIMRNFLKERYPLEHADRDDYSNMDDPLVLRRALLDFIADFANWDNSTDERYLKTVRALTQSAHESLGGAPGSRPLVVDPFAGGGAIPLEALRVGADAFASDLNPVSVLLNKVVLEYIPKYGQKLADEVRRWGEWIKVEAEKDLAQFYPHDPDGATPVAYLWARTITCEGPGCGAEVPLLRSLWLAKKGSQSVALKISSNQEERHVDFEIIHEAQDQDVGHGTVKRGSATCPICGYTTPVVSVRRQLKDRCGGAGDARLFCVVTTQSGNQGRFFRLPTERDIETVQKAATELEKRKAKHQGLLSLVPVEPLPLMSGVFNAPIYGHNTWGSLFTPRQALALAELTFLVSNAKLQIEKELPADLSVAVYTVLSLAIGRIADIGNSLCIWKASMSQVIHLFTRQAVPMLWDFAEASFLSDAAGDFKTTITNMSRILDRESLKYSAGFISCDSATAHPLSDDSADALITDPPYYNAVPYADLSDFFYVWLRRVLRECYPQLFSTELSPKEDEICEMAGWDPIRYSYKTKNFFESRMQCALEEGRRILKPEGIGIIVFAHKSTSGWEAQLQALINSGWKVTGSWPIDTELANRLRARNSAVLASSIHLVCRPRENSNGSIRDEVGDWRNVLQELPERIHAWLPRLAKEGVVGADAIFSCLGPALEIYSRYSRVEKASGEQVPLPEYLVEVWAAVSREALSTIFSGDTTSFEEDARLTAMWLWTLSAGANGNGNHEDDDDPDEEVIDTPGRSKLSGFILEYDAARKISQGLGVRLENLPSLVEIKGDKARLLPVSERAPYLLGQEAAPIRKRKKDKTKQMILGEGGSSVEIIKSPAIEKTFSPGLTILDRVHQAMLLFGENRSDALKSFLQETGQDQSFWSLAQALNSLYPVGSEERRWVEGVLSRKKSLGV
jgi:putative DNA methylase